MTPTQRAAAVIAEEALDMGNDVALKDTAGSAVTRDLYALGLCAATKENVHPVRALTAAIDVLYGLRDYVRGPKKGIYFGPCYVAKDMAEYAELFG
jgi:hypothetical protein